MRSLALTFVTKMYVDCSTVVLTIRSDYTIHIPHWKIYICLYLKRTNERVTIFRYIAHGARLSAYRPRPFFCQPNKRKKLDDEEQQQKHLPN